MAKLTTSNLKIKKDGSKQYIYLEDDGKEHIIVAFSSSAADPRQKITEVQTTHGVHNPES